ncbi:MAG: response regulator [Leptospiraceae bacterium]|nr:response regulator [Leptospiraceae bacterium]
MRKVDKVVYLLDDDSEFCEEIKELLENLVQITVFNKPVDFVDALNQQRPDLALIDLNLNDENYNGLDVIRTIKSRNDSHLISIIMVSGADSTDILQKAFKSGIQDYVLKPVIPHLFFHKVESIIYDNHRLIHTNALTGLPGIKLIEENYERRRAAGKIFSVAYCDLDYFKPFNDEKGVKAGDEAIALLSDILLEIRRSYSRSQLFAGHLGGDDFFLLGSKTHVSKASKQIEKMFAVKITGLFSKDENNQGWYRATDREGATKRIPLLSISTAVLNVPASSTLSFNAISEIASSIKKKAKSIPGNSIVYHDILSMPGEKNLFNSEQKVEHKNIIMNDAKIRTKRSS